MDTGIIGLLIEIFKTLGAGYLFLEGLSLIFILIIIFYLRKIFILNQITLNKIDKLEEDLDPDHLYSKLNKFENDMEKYDEALIEHQHEEVRQLFEIHNLVTKIDTRMHTRNHSKD